MLHPKKIVVRRMVDPIRDRRTDIQHRYAGMIQERRIIEPLPILVSDEVIVRHRIGFIPLLRDSVHEQRAEASYKDWPERILRALLASTSRGASEPTLLP